jgi:trk system potassium uptake protein TrkA
MKRIIIIGLSSYGYYLAKALSTYDNIELITVDHDENTTQKVRDFVHRPLIGDGTSLELLEQLQVDEADYIVVSLGRKMDSSILTVLHLKELNAKHVIVKADNIDHAKVLHKLGAEQVIFPEKDMAEITAIKLVNPNIFEIMRLTGDYSLAEVPPPVNFEGTELKDLQLPQKYDINVVLIKNVLTNETFLPRANYVVKSGDIMYIMGKNEDIEAFQKLIK